MRVGFEGVDRLELNQAGQLVLHLQDGEVSLKAPSAYQMIDGQKRPVEVAWKQVAGSEATFRAGRTIGIRRWSSIRFWSTEVMSTPLECLWSECPTR